MKSLLMIVAFIAVPFVAQAANWEDQSTVNVEKICGTLSLADTMYDGVQNVFQTKDSAGKDIGTYFIEPMGSLDLGFLVKNEVHDVCIIGIPSQAQIIDSAPTFYTFEVLF